LKTPSRKRSLNTRELRTLDIRELDMRLRFTIRDVLWLTLVAARSRQH